MYAKAMSRAKPDDDKGLLAGAFGSGRFHRAKPATEGTEVPEVARRGSVRRQKEPKVCLQEPLETAKLQEILGG